MLERALAWIQYWLPFIQGFAALASIGGALLSWRYALKAQRAREEMTRNVITSKLVTTLDFVVAQLSELRASAVEHDADQITLSIELVGRKARSSSKRRSRKLVPAVHTFASHLNSGAK